MPADRVNVADRLTAAAAAAPPDQQAVIAYSQRGKRAITFAQLESDATAVARGLIAMGVQPGMRLALLVPPGVEFVALVFGLLRSGATTVLVDPGMGRKHLLDCLAATEPEGFIAVSRAQAVRGVLRRRFPHAKHNVTVGRRWFWGGLTYEQLLARGGWHAQGPPQGVAKANSASASDHAPRGLGRATQDAAQHALPITHADDPAAIIFTSGSTGPPKGVLYTHRMFDTQTAEIQRAYHLQPGGVDLACFALFGLFNSAMGVTTVFPDMDFSRPASADPRKLLAAANAQRVTQAFASPAVWDTLGRHCEQTGERIPTLRKVFSCGAPVRAEVIRRTLDFVCSAGEAEMHTPYGATEALPVATIEAAEVLGETASKTAAGAGVCVGRKFDSIEWRVIRISDKPIENIDAAEELPHGEIGELIVRGPQVSPGYAVTTVQPRALPGGSAARIPATEIDLAAKNPRAEPGAEGWHRMGDVGYLDDAGRFWYCGRKSHRVETRHGTLYTECVEAILNQHPEVMRSALVPLGPRPCQFPYVIVELHEQFRSKYMPDKADYWFQHQRLSQELEQIALSSPVTRAIKKFLHRSPFPVDVRHNAKINREQLASDAGLGVDPGGVLLSQRDESS